MAEARAVVFDLGGVLVHVDWERVLGGWDERLGLPGGSTLRALFAGTDETALVGRVSAEATWGRACAGLGLDDAGCAALQRDVRDAHAVDRRVARLISSLGPHVRVGALSNAWSDGRWTARELGYDALFDDMVFSAEVGIAKPDPRIFALAARRLGVSPAQGVLVDDTPGHVAVAQSLGFAGVVFADAEQAIAEVRDALGACRRRR